MGGYVFAAEDVQMQGNADETTATTEEVKSSTSEEGVTTEVATSEALLRVQLLKM